MRVWIENLKCPKCNGDLHVHREREYFIDPDVEFACRGCQKVIPPALILAATDELNSAEKRIVATQAAQTKANEVEVEDDKGGNEDDKQAKNELYKSFKEEANRIGSDATEKLFDVVGLKGNDRPTVKQAKEFIEKAKPLKGKSE